MEKKDLSSENNITFLRYNSSKGIFIFICFLFFFCFFIIWAWYNKEILYKILSPLYIMLLLSFNLYIFYFLKIKFIEKKVLAYVFSSLSILLSILALFIII